MSEDNIIITNKKENDAKLYTIKIGLEGLTCSSCVKTVETIIKNLNGILPDSISVTLLPESMVQCEFHEGDVTEDDIVQSIENVGFGAVVMDCQEKATTLSETNSIYHVKMGLEGLTCSSCVKTVEHSIKNLQGIVPESVKVALLPECILECDFHREEVTEEDIVQSIENVGFGAVVMECQEKNINPRVRTIYIEVEQNSDLALSYFENHDAVQDVQLVSTPSSKPKKATSSSRARLKVIYRDDLCGIRDLVSGLSDSPHAIEAGGCGEVNVMDSMSFQSSVNSSEQRRRAEIEQWKHAFIFSAAFAIPVFMISMVFMHIPGLHHYFMQFVGSSNITWEELLTFLLATPVQFISGAKFYKDSYYSIKTRQLGMSFLIALGTSAAYFYSIFVLVYNARHNPTPRLMQAFESSALLIMFVLLGKFLEVKAKSNTSKAISKLVSLTPQTTTLVGYIQPTTRTFVPLTPSSISTSMIQHNDILLIKPGETIPTDGIIYSDTTTTLNESIITGESLPVTKSQHDPVIGGTLNIDGSIQMLVTVTGNETTLSKIIQLVQNAQSTKPPIQQFADYIASRFTPFVLCVALLTFFLWVLALNIPNLVSAETKSSWGYHQKGLNDVTLPLLFFISVLVIACPCALGLATPTALMVGSGVGAKHGILIKNGQALETTARHISSVVFDKTGTLTRGLPTVSDVLLLSPSCARFRFCDALGEEGVEIVQHDQSSHEWNEMKNFTSKQSSEYQPQKENVGSLEKENVGSLEKENVDSSNEIVADQKQQQSMKVNGSCCSQIDQTIAKQQHYEGYDNVDPSYIIGATVQNIFFLAACAEYGSEHPLAKGILAKAEEFDIGPDLKIPLLPVTDFLNEPGKGISCKIQEKHMIRIGNRRSLDNTNVCLRPGTMDAMEYLERKGQTSVVLSVDGYTEAVIGLIDEPKDEASLTVAILQQMGKDVYMLTGDNSQTAQVVAKQIGIPPSHIFSDTLPEDKVNCIKQLQQETSSESAIAMVGDGINDSPALAQADLGIALGAGTDVAIETASIVLVHSNLMHVLLAFDLAKTIYRRIKLNFVWALGYNTLAIPIAAGVLFPVLHVALPPYMAALAMALSSLSVLFSSLLLNRYRAPNFEKQYKRLQHKMHKNQRQQRHTASNVTLTSSDGSSHVVLQIQSAETQNNALEDPTLTMMDKLNSYYPGCQSIWGKSCKCGIYCKCPGCPNNKID